MVVWKYKLGFGGTRERRNEGEASTEEKEAKRLIMKGFLDQYRSLMADE